MENFDLYVNDDPKELYAITQKIRGEIPRLEKKLTLVGQLDSELQSGSFPVITDFSLLNIRSALRSDPEVEAMLRTLVRDCDSQEIPGLLDKYIDSMRFEGKIHEVKYVGEVDAVPENFPVPSGRRGYDGINDLRFDSQIFISQYGQINSIRDPKLGHDVIVANRSMHLRRAQNSRNDEYVVSNNIGDLVTSNKVASKIRSIKIVHTGDLLQLLC